MNRAHALAEAMEAVLAKHGAALLYVLAAVVLLAGFGLRNPWPADEPRFAAIARDMLETGDWLFPRIGGDLYADKPPLYFWMLAGCFWLTGSVRLGFLIPSVTAGLVTLTAVYDLARRLYGRETGVLAGLVLLSTFQFALEFKDAQIDPVLTMWTTVALYGLLRHLLLGPAWGWYALGGLASGLGVITKGVGFLPLLILLPYAWLTARGWRGAAGRATWRWSFAPLAAVAGIAMWLVPMLLAVAASGSPELAAYRDEILLHQTVGRYTAAPGHLHGWWYFVLAVIPWAWLPVSLALPWLWGHWRAALRARDLRLGLLLAWIAMVVAFFSLSSGKRGVYLLPAVPALAIVTAPYVRPLLRVLPLQRAAWALVLVACAATAAASVYFGLGNDGGLDEEIAALKVSPTALVLPLAAVAA
ncbi:MAG TPA: glycosyltransferase family 39 protein, partial [Gammaproteobacteria bacterium]|nr:glycosyltransferase family 39 protein [Gammaproteobacteria bacterium]